MSRCCLLVTYISLLDLKTKKVGIYRRLQILLEGAKASESELVVFCIESQVENKKQRDEFSGSIELELRELWGINCTVVVGSMAKASKLSWFVQQMRGVFHFDLQPYPLSLLDDTSKKLLSAEVDKKPDFIIAHRIQIMSLLLKLNIKDTAIFYDVDDVEHVSLIRGLKFLNLRNVFFQLLYLPSLLYTEARTIYSARKVYVCSDVDAEKINGLFLTSKASVVPNCIDFEEVSSDLSERPVMLMVGNYNFGPNIEAVEYYMLNIFPAIKKSCPQAEIWFVGGGSELLDCYKAVAGVKVFGFVEDLKSIYQQARVVICPVRRGSGTRVKLVEAAMFGVPIVTTTIGAEGLGMVNGKHAIFSDTPRDFSAACVKLISDDSLCIRLGENAKELSKNSFNKNNVVKNLALDFLSL